MDVRFAGQVNCMDSWFHDCISQTQQAIFVFGITLRWSADYTVAAANWRDQAKRISRCPGMHQGSAKVKPRHHCLDPLALLQVLHLQP